MKAQNLVSILSNLFLSLSRSLARSLVLPTSNSTTRNRIDLCGRSEVPGEIGRREQGRCVIDADCALRISFRVPYASRVRLSLTTFLGVLEMSKLISISCPIGFQSEALEIGSDL